MFDFLPVGHRVDQPLRGPDPFGRRQEDLAPLLAGPHHDPIQADVVDDHAVREVFDLEPQLALIAVALDFEHRGYRLARLDHNLRRRMVGRGRFAFPPGRGADGR